jgi:hypothetical protein
LLPVFAVHPQGDAPWRRATSHRRVRRHDSGLVPGIFLIPALYVAFQRLRERIKGGKPAAPGTPAAQSPATH